MQSMRDIVDFLNRATVAYDKGEPIMTDSQWDQLYFKLLDMERKTGIIEPDSPTQAIYFEPVSTLKKVVHSHKMLSLEKTKDIDEIKNFIGKEDILAMCKLDGLTCSLTYKNGKLVAAETRGNGLIGEDILHNAMVIPSIPKRIRYQEELVVDGEILCKIQDFETFASGYKHPRNFAAGSIRLLDSRECAKRKLTFVAWDVKVGYSTLNTLMDKLIQLQSENFVVVPWDKGDPAICVETLKETANLLGYPIDGCVFKFNDIAYGESLGETSHHFKNAMAFKFYDETYETKLLDIEWSLGRTGQITPVAIFEPIDIDGATVERASLHNISIIEELCGGVPRIGDTLFIYKANQIIPQVNSWENDGEGIELSAPSICPVCGEAAKIRIDNNSKMLVCTNLNCSGRLINQLDHFCGKKGLDIKGLSKATLEKLMSLGWVNNYIDLFQLKTFANQWASLAGFGQKSVSNILNAIEDSRHCELHQFIAALGIPLIGTTASKALAQEFLTWDNFISAVENKYHFYDISGFGPEMHSAITKFNYYEAKILANQYLSFKEKEEEEENQSASLKDLTFVITGKLNHFKNRDEIKNLIENLGGKVTSAVSKNTNYLINNDTSSGSSKNKTAQSLGIPILSEESFFETFGISN